MSFLRSAKIQAESRSMEERRGLGHYWSWVTTGADIGTMLTGLSAVTATFLWGRTRVREWKAERDARAARNWNGYIIREGVATWFVRVVEDDSAKWSERVILHVVDEDGTPNPSVAHALRLHARGDGMLSRCPPRPSGTSWVTSAKRGSTLPRGCTPSTKSRVTRPGDAPLAE